jgi:hypothetical protein
MRLGLYGYTPPPGGAWNAYRLDEEENRGLMMIVVYNFCERARGITCRWISHVIPSFLSWKLLVSLCLFCELISHM